MKKINSRFRIGGTSIRMPSQFCNIALFILASSGLCIFWGDSLVFFELTNEIADVVKATVNGNIRNRQWAVIQKDGSFFDAVFIQEGKRCLAHLLMEISAEIGRAHAGNGFFCYCYTVKIKLNILTLEYTKQICYNAITSKKHSLFTMILYREIRLPKMLTANIFIPNW